MILLCQLNKENEFILKSNDTSENKLQLIESKKMEVNETTAYRSSQLTHLAQQFN